MAPRKLRPVRAGDEPRRPLTVSKAARDGSRRDLLVALRSRLAVAVEDPNTLARDLASSSRRLLEIAKEIESLDADSDGDAVGHAAATPDEEWVSS